ncbi:heme-binding protein [Maribacter vaceletii]|uniref:Heme-binding protein n=1 Tax=Maribacter vaceletii TaxID=1206816 RepID=A0A495E5T6_9FLAO|nr:heme-binding domain-containing protein [Maribacter vaceletii]RKR12304.1 heme-binding protein [Maribacter vaceletii]
MKKVVKIILVCLVIVLIILQFFSVDQNNAEIRDVTDFEAETKPSKEVAAILEKQCYDCHTNKTVYPWYGKIAPVSMWMADHIEEGNEHFNLTEWNKYNDKKKDHKLDELIEEVEENKMPLKEYTWTHGNITEEEKESLIKWAKEARAKYKVH